MIVEMIRWWYTNGWLDAARRITSMTMQTSRTFSIPVLIRTLFAPWRRIMSPPGRGLDAKIQAAFDNFISRCVGFVVRLLVLLSACIVCGLTAIYTTIIAIAWPLIPGALIYSLYRVLIG